MVSLSVIINAFQKFSTLRDGFKDSIRKGSLDFVRRDGVHRSPATSFSGESRFELRDELEAVEKFGRDDAFRHTTPQSLFCNQ
jgi:hypothetical protein